MAGTIPLSMTQQFDVYGQPLAGGQLYIIQAGTVSTPQDAFQDVGLTIKQPYPMSLDAAGRIPQFFLNDPSGGGNATVKIRLQDKNGVVQLAADNVLVIGPSGGTGGGGTTVDPSAIYQTGDIKPRYGVGVHPGVTPGWVRANGMAIGSVTSTGFTDVERANADCQPLFLYLWNTDPNLAVSGVRGANASADWTANKQIRLPDYRGYVIGALDDMGNVASGRISILGAQATMLGGVGGGQVQVLTNANLPPYTPAGTITNGAITTSMSPNVGNILSSSGAVQVGGGGSFFSYNLNNLSFTSSQLTSTFTGTAQVGNNSTPFSLLSPRKLCTVYIKL